LTAAPDGGVQLAGDLGRLFRISPPVVRTANGPDVTTASGARYEVRRGAALGGDDLAVIVDRSWLSKQPAKAFPLTIDPTINGNGFGVAPTNQLSFGSNGVTLGGTSVQVGLDSGGTAWRAAAYFNQ